MAEKTVNAFETVINGTKFRVSSIQSDTAKMTFEELVRARLHRESDKISAENSA